MLRENFTQFNIPLMALTATATNPVREDILKSLHMSKETEIILTSFFRPNLRFSVCGNHKLSSRMEKMLLILQFMLSWLIVLISNIIFELNLADSLVKLLNLTSLAEPIVFSIINL